MPGSPSPAAERLGTDAAPPAAPDAGGGQEGPLPPERPVAGAAPAVSAGGREPAPFAYALVRVVPRVERGECLNAGVVLFCRSRRFLDARLELDRRRLQALAPDLDLDAVAVHLDLIGRVCAGDPAAGPIARLPAAERFGWLVAPASTVVQPGPVHAGLAADPAAALDQLFATMVRPLTGGAGGPAGPLGDG